MRPAPRRSAGLAGIATTAGRWFVALPVAVVVTAVVLNSTVRDAPGVGAGSLACAVMMEVAPPLNVCAFAALTGLLLAGTVVGLDLGLACLVGGFGTRATLGLGAALLVLTIAGLIWADVGVFC